MVPLAIELKFFTLLFCTFYLPALFLAFLMSHYLHKQTLPLHYYSLLTLTPTPTLPIISNLKSTYSYLSEQSRGERESHTKRSVLLLFKSPASTSRVPLLSIFSFKIFFFIFFFSKNQQTPFPYRSSPLSLSCRMLIFLPSDLSLFLLIHTCLLLYFFIIEKSAVFFFFSKFVFFLGAWDKEKLRILINR